MKFGSFGYCDYECHNLSQRTVMEKVKEENKRSYCRNNKKEANIIIIIITIVELPSVGELRNNFTWIEERN